MAVRVVKEEKELLANYTHKKILIFDICLQTNIGLKFSTLQTAQNWEFCECVWLIICVRPTLILICNSNRRGSLFFLSLFWLTHRQQQNNQGSCTNQFKSVHKWQLHVKPCRQSRTFTFFSCISSTQHFLAHVCLTLHFITRMKIP